MSTRRSPRVLLLLPVPEPPPPAARNSGPRGPRSTGTPYPLALRRAAPFPILSLSSLCFDKAPLSKPPYSTSFTRAKVVETEHPPPPSSPRGHLIAPPPESATRHARFGAAGRPLSVRAAPSAFHLFWSAPHFPHVDCVLQDNSIAVVAHRSTLPQSIHVVPPSPHRGPTPSVSLRHLEVTRQVPLVP
jgi:hypothetical protein